MALDKAAAKYVKESDEEESRAVEMYDMVSLVSTRSSKIAMQASTGAEGEHKASEKEKEITPDGDEPKTKEAAVVADTGGDEEIQIQAERAPEGTAEIKAVPAHREKQHAMELAEKTMLPAPKVVLEVGTIRRGQEQQPMMAAIKAYVYRQQHTTER